MKLSPTYYDATVAQSQGATEGWWAVDEAGTLVFGPYPTREAVIVHIAEKRGSLAIAGDE